MKLIILASFYYVFEMVLGIPIKQIALAPIFMFWLYLWSVSPVRRLCLYPFHLLVMFVGMSSKL